MNTSIIEWGGKNYELKYSFAVVRRLRQEGVNITEIFRAVQNNPDSVANYIDDFVIMTACLLREAGVIVTNEQLWEHSKGNREFISTVSQLFWWVVGEHFASSSMAPKAKAGKKPQARKPRKKT